jgi:hypothetical protein
LNVTPHIVVSDANAAGAVPPEEVAAAAARAFGG